MSWWSIAWKSVRQRGFASFLTSFSIALGVCLVVLVLTVHGVISKSFRTNSGIGYENVVGPKGGKMSLALNTVFYLGAPIGSVPYEYYLAFQNKDLRQHQMRHSFAFQNQVQTRQNYDIQSFQNPREDSSETASLDQWIWEETENFQTEKELKINNDGLFNLFTQTAVPILLGDTYGAESRFKVVGTNPDFFHELVIDPDKEVDNKLTTESGRIFKSWTEENDVFEAVAGWEVAQAEGLKVGDFVSPIHGDLNAGGHEHQQQFRLVGILKHSGTPNDRVMFVNMEGFYLMIDHIKPLVDEGIRKKIEEPQPNVPILPEGDEFEAALDAQLENLRDNESDLTENNQADSSDSNALEESSKPNVLEEQSSEEKDAAQQSPKGVKPLRRSEPLPIEQREITGILVRYKSVAGTGSFTVAPLIENGELEGELEWSSFRPKLAQRSAQAINPIQEIYTLLSLFVDPIQRLLLFLTVLICIVSGISILVSIYNSMNDRKQEIAIMRALGASRWTIMGVILSETTIISVGGAFFGWVAAHLVNGAISPWVRQYTGVTINPLTFAPSVVIQKDLGIQLSTELLLVPVMILFALIVGIIPAITAYRTDVSENL